MCGCRKGQTCGYACEGREGERDEDDGEDRNDKVGGHVASLVIVIVGHGRTRNQTPVKKVGRGSIDRAKV